MDVTASHPIPVTESNAKQGNVALGVLVLQAANRGKPSAERIVPISNQAKNIAELVGTSVMLAWSAKMGNVAPIASSMRQIAAAFVPISSSLACTVELVGSHVAREKSALTAFANPTVASGPFNVARSASTFKVISAIVVAATNNVKMVKSVPAVSVNSSARLD